MNDMLTNLNEIYLVNMSLLKDIEPNEEDSLLNDLGLSNKNIMYFGVPVRPILKNTHVETLITNDISEKILYAKDKVFKKTNFSQVSFELKSKKIKLVSPSLFIEEELDRYLDTMLSFFYILEILFKKNERLVIFSDVDCEYKKYFEALNTFFKNISFVYLKSYNKIKSISSLYTKLKNELRKYLQSIYKIWWFLSAGNKVIIGSSGRDLPEYFNRHFQGITKNNTIGLNQCLYISKFISTIFPLKRLNRFYLTKNLIEINNPDNLEIPSKVKDIILKNIVMLNKNLTSKIEGLVNSAILILSSIPKKNVTLVTHHHDGLNGILSEALTRIGCESHLVPHGSFFRRNDSAISRTWNRYAIIFGFIPCTHIAARSSIVYDYYSNQNFFNNVNIISYERKNHKIQHESNALNLLHASTPKSSYVHRRSFLYENVSEYFSNIISIAEYVEKSNKITSFNVLVRKLNESNMIAEDLVSMLSGFKKTKVLIDENFLHIVNKFQVVISYSSSVIEETLHLNKKCILYNEFGGYDYKLDSNLQSNYDNLLISCNSIKYFSEEFDIYA